MFLSDGFIIYDGTTRVDQMVGAADPRVLPGAAAPQASLMQVYDGVGSSLYMKTGPADTDWTLFSPVPEGTITGQILWWDDVAAAWTLLDPDTDGFVLTTHDAGFAPSWERGIQEQGIEAFAAGDVVLPVAFGTAMTAATYEVSLAVGLTNPGDPIYAAAVENKTVNGFDIRLSGPVLPGGSLNVEWTAVRI